MTPNTPGKSKPLQVLMWSPVRLGRWATVARTISSDSPAQLCEIVQFSFREPLKRPHVER